MIKWIGQTNSVTYGFRVMKAKSQKRKKSGTTSCACQLTAHFDVPLTRWFNWTWWFNWTLFSLVWFERAGRSTAIANSDSRHRTVDTERYSTVQYSTLRLGGCCENWNESLAIYRSKQEMVESETRIFHLTTSVQLWFLIILTLLTNNRYPFPPSMKDSKKRFYS